MFICWFARQRIVSDFRDDIESSDYVYKDQSTLVAARQR